VASPVFKTAWAAVRSPEGSTPFLLRLRYSFGGLGREVGGEGLVSTSTPSTGVD
jgi:hypothetical protein